MTNLGKTVYGRNFQQEENERNISTHGSPTMEKYWDTNKEDENVRHDMIKKFGQTTQSKSAMTFSGFDGTFLYTFQSNGCPTVKDGIGNTPDTYNRQYVITKHGDRKNKSVLSDIERFLIENHFEMLETL